jgi:hypothetical protein
MPLTAATDVALIGLTSTGLMPTVRGRMIVFPSGGNAVWN